ncbi:MAG: adenylate/guanylate cyclase domain-containing protein [Candidatus Binatia bacterium]
MPQAREWFQTARARYTCYGFLFGCCFPLAATVYDLFAQNLTFSVAYIWQVQTAQPFHWVIDSAPFFLGWFAGVAGKQQDVSRHLNDQLEMQNAQLQTRSAALAQANVNAAELMVELEEVRDTLTNQNAQLQEKGKALADANVHAAELMVELEEARSLLEERNAQLDLHNRFIRQTFGRYLTNEVVASLLDDPAGLELGGEKREVSLLMADLRGFTSLSERLSPEAVVKILNRYLGTMTDIILQHQGTIDEFIGDSIFVIFGAPVHQKDHATRAVACALSMQLAMEEVNASNQQEGLPVLAMGIGIHTGEVVVGNIGSEKRAKYGAVGRPVNLTSRIESYTVGSQIFISESTRQKIDETLIIAHQLEIEAKGIDAPITISEVRGMDGTYHLVLPEHEEMLRTLLQPLAVQYTVMEGKHLGDAIYTGQLMKLSENRGEIHAAQPAPLWSNLRLRLPTVHSGKGADIYAKVIGYPSEDHTQFTVHFTSVPPVFATFFQEQARRC